MTWTDHPACKTATACDRCQTSGRFVASLIRRFGPFICPLGIAIAAPVPGSVPAAAPAAGPPPSHHPPAAPCHTCGGLAALLLLACIALAAPVQAADSALAAGRVPVSIMPDLRAENVPAAMRTKAILQILGARAAARFPVMSRQRSQTLPPPAPPAPRAEPAPGPVPAASHPAGLSYRGQPLLAGIPGARRP